MQTIPQRLSPLVERVPSDYELSRYLVRTTQRYFCEGTDMRGLGLGVAVMVIFAAVPTVSSATSAHKCVLRLLAAKAR